MDLVKCPACGSANVATRPYGYICKYCKHAWEVARAPFKVRFSRSMLDRLAGASARHVIEQAEIVRRAVRYSLRLGVFDSVADCENSESTTDGDAFELALTPDMPDFSSDPDAPEKLRAAITRYLNDKDRPARS